MITANVITRLMSSNLLQIQQVPSNRLLGILFQKEVTYCYYSANFIAFSLSQMIKLAAPTVICNSDEIQ